MKLPKSPPRYCVKGSGPEVTLWLDGPYHPDDKPGELIFWVPAEGGYVRETTHAPGTLGRQVCETLFGLGSALWSSPRHLADDIRQYARRHCDGQDRAGGGPLIEIVVDMEANANDWWDAAREAWPGCPFFLVDRLDESGSAVVRRSTARAFVEWSAKIPGWHTGMSRAPHPVLLRAVRG